MTTKYSARQQEIISVLCTGLIADIGKDADRRRNGLAKYMYSTGLSTYVLGVSGGVDSTTASILAQQACQDLRNIGYAAKFIAVRLPYGEQHDEDDAQRALDIIKPDQVVTINIKQATDAMLAQINILQGTPGQIDFIKGNIKARQRMIAQYALAGQYGGMVIGTDHAAEALMGFFTKFGDGAADVIPMWNLTKGQVRLTAIHLGAPESLAYKTPTADLEDLKPGLPDESAFGVSYQEIDDFLLGRPISDQAAEIIIKQYNKTQHKRNLPAQIA